MTYGEQMKKILDKFDIDTSTLPDNLYSTLLEAIYNVDVAQDVGVIDDIGSCCGYGTSVSDRSGVQDMIKSFSIPDGSTKIPDYAFQSCYNLTNVTIPNTVTSMGYYAFMYCENLANIYYKGTEEQWNAITKNTGWNKYMGSKVTGGTVIHYNS